MESGYIKHCSMMALGLFLLGAVKAQDPEFVKMGTGASDPVYYQHGYNKDSGNAIDTPREDRDSVMVGATMHYFVMPDLSYNSAYATSAASGDFSNTNLTTSTFEWTVPTSGSSAVFVNPNSKDGSTSPHVTIAWTAASAEPSTDTIRIVETPTEYNGVPLSSTSVCIGKESKIPVTVIPKSVIEFGEDNGLREIYTCLSFDLSDGTTHPVLDFPLTVATKVAGNKGIKVKYTIQKDTGSPSGAIEVGLADITKLPIKVDDYGVYTVTITEITDPIARKCNLTGTVTDASNKNVFKYAVLPQPQPGKTYHVPNNY